MPAVDLLIERGDVRTCAIAESGEPELEERQALLSVDSFGLTANNVTYAVLGDAMRYWDFFPGPDGWGRMPVWGFAEVTEPRDTGLEAGERVFGFLPPSTHFVATPERVDERGFTDGAPHRVELPSAYQGYRRTASDPAYAPDREHEQMIFWPLFYTSWLIDDFLADEGFFGAGTMLIGSASSKTALIAAFMLAQREDVELVGLTSTGNRAFVEGTGIYDATVSYDEIGGLERTRSVYVDMSGDAEVRAAVHERLGDALAYDAAVGLSHWDRLGGGLTSSEGLPGPAPRMFFAPDRLRKRGEDWGTALLDERVVAAWKPFVEWSGGWLQVQRGEGLEAAEEVYAALLDGAVEPATGHVIELR